MKITIVTGPFLSPPPAPCGSVERLWHDLAEVFARRGHQVSFLCRAYPGQVPLETIHGVSYIRRTTFERSGKLWRDLPKDLAYSLALFPLLPEADILATNAMWLPVLARHLRPEAGKLVVNQHRYPKGQMMLYGSVARIATVSRAIRDAVVAQYPRAAAKVRIFPNPIDASIFVPPAAPRQHKDPVIVYTGRVHPEKGLQLLIEAAARLKGEFPGCKLRIIGPWEIAQGGGGEDYQRSLKQRGEALGLSVEFTGPIYDRHVLAAALQEADAYCYPSLAEKGEALPIAPIEAMATGLAPVVSNLDCFKDYVEDGVTGYIFDHRGGQAASNLAEVLRRVLADPEKTARMGAEAARCSARFSNEKVADMYLEDFAQLLGAAKDERACAQSS